MTNTTVTIDYRWYPHIIDEIIKHAPHSSLVKRRATNSVFKDRVNALLCNKLNLRHRRFSPYFTVLSPTGERIPGLQRIPLIRYKFNEQLEHLLEHTKHTQFVEIEGPVYTPCDARVVAPAFPNLDTFRILTHRALELPSMIRYFPFSCKIVVFFCQDLDGGQFWLDDPEDDDPDEPHHLPASASQRLPDKDTKLVLNMSGAEVSLDMDLTCLIYSATKLETCVLVYPEYRLSKLNPHFCYCIHDSESLSAIAADIDDMAETTTVPSIVVVGLEQVATVLLEKMKSEHEIYHYRARTEEEWNSLLARFTFLSREEYAKQVGDTNLELVEYLDGFRACCPCCYHHA